MTALMYAAQDGNTEVVRLLIEKGAQKGIRNVYKRSAYDIAKEQGYMAIMELLSSRQKKEQY